jgi:hypothetical protein
MEKSKTSGLRVKKSRVVPLIPRSTEIPSQTLVSPPWAAGVMQ